MSKKEDALFEAWKTETESKLASNPKKLEAFQALVDGKDEQSLDVFRAAHRGEDYYRRLNEFNEEKRTKEDEIANSKADLETRQAQLLGWYEQEKPKNERLVQEKAELVGRLTEAQEYLKSMGLEDEARKVGADLREVRSVRSTESSVSNEEVAELKKKMSILERGLPTLLSQFGSVVNKIASEKWNVEPSAVVDFSSKRGVDLEQAFNHLTSDERVEREKTRMTELEKKWKDEGRREALSKVANPDFQRPSGPSIVDTLRDENQKLPSERDRVASAVQEFISLEHSGGGI